MGEIDFYAMKLNPPQAAEGAGVNGGGLFAVFERSFPYQEEAIRMFLDVQGWVELPGTRQQLVLSPVQAEPILRQLRASARDEFRERGFVMQIHHHSEEDGEVFDAQRFFQCCNKPGFLKSSLLLGALRVVTSQAF
jgi:hypothetical protein